MQSLKKNSINKAALSGGDQLLLPCTVNYYFITTQDQVLEAVDELLPISSNPKNMLAIDVETNGFDPYLKDILLLQIGTKENTQYIFDARRLDLKLLKPVLDSPCWKLGQNIKFDAKFIQAKLGIKLSKFYDTLLAEKIIRGGEYSSGCGYALDAILKYRLDVELKIETHGFSGLDAKEGSKLERAKKYMQQSFLTMGKDDEFTEAQLAYAAQDVAGDTIFRLVDKQIELLYRESVNTLYDPEAQYITDQEVKSNYEQLFKPRLRLWETAKLEFKFLEVVIDIELSGINFSKEKHTDVLNNIIRDYKEYRKEFLCLLGSKIPQRTLMGTASLNPDSNQQVLAALNSLKLKMEDTKAETLVEKITELKPGTEKYSILETLLNYRTMSILVKSYGETLSSLIHPVTGRLNYEIQQILDTGRISTNEPNIQKIPSKVPWRKTGNIKEDADIESRDGLRECFTAPQGYKLIVYDYDSQELRVVASISRDSNMLDAFKHKKNLHCYSASLMYNEDYDELYSKYKAGEPETVQKRKEAKTVSFGVIYGSGAANLARTLGIILERAKDIIERLWLAYPELKKAMGRYGEISNKVGYSNTILGRRRYFTDIMEKIKWVQCEKSIVGLEDRAKEEGMEWLFEKEGGVTRENFQKFKEALIKKFRNKIGRQASNHSVQGSSADITKLAAVKIRRELLDKGLDAKIVGLIHDEIIVECKEAIAIICSEIVKRNMEEALSFFCPNVPAIADGKISDCWKK